MDIASSRGDGLKKTKKKTEKGQAEERAECAGVKQQRQRRRQQQQRQQQQQQQQQQ